MAKHRAPSFCSRFPAPHEPCLAVAANQILSPSLLFSGLPSFVVPAAPIAFPDSAVGGLTRWRDKNQKGNPKKPDRAHRKRSSIRLVSWLQGRRSLSKNAEMGFVVRRRRAFVQTRRILPEVKSGKSRGFHRRVSSCFLPLNFCIRSRRRDDDHDDDRPNGSCAMALKLSENESDGDGDYIPKGSQKQGFKMSSTQAKLRCGLEHQHEQPRLTKWGYWNRDTNDIHHRGPISEDQDHMAKHLQKETGEYGGVEDAAKKSVQQDDNCEEKEHEKVVECLKCRNLTRRLLRKGDKRYKKSAAGLEYADESSELKSWLKKQEEKVKTKMDSAARRMNGATPDRKQLQTTAPRRMNGATPDRKQLQTLVWKLTGLRVGEKAVEESSPIASSALKGVSTITSDLAGSAAEGSDLSTLGRNKSAIGSDLGRSGSDSAKGSDHLASPGKSGIVMETGLASSGKAESDALRQSGIAIGRMGLGSSGKGAGSSAMSNDNAISGQKGDSVNMGSDLASLDAKMDLMFEQVLRAVEMVAEMVNKSGRFQQTQSLLADDEEESVHSRLTSSCRSELGAAVQIELSPSKYCVRSLAALPLLREFREAVEDARLKMRVLAGLLTVEKDAKMTSARDFQSRKMILVKMMRAQMEGNVFFQKPWHIKYGLDFCVSSIFFKGTYLGSSSSPMSSNYNSPHSFDSFFQTWMQAMEAFVGSQMKIWSDTLKSMFWNCAVCCFHVHTLITASGCRGRVKILHPRRGTSFDASAMDPLDTGALHTFNGKVLFTIFSGFMLGDAVLCKPQVYLEPKIASIRL